MAFPAVTELVKGPIDESLKKLVQPAAIVPATVFLLLNLAVIYPRLLDGGVGAAAAFKDLEDSWKAVILLVWILVSGYVLLNLNGSMLRLATGELIAETPVGQWLRARERQRIVRFRARLAAWKGKAPMSVLTADMKLPNLDQAAPTRLGNVFNGANRQLVDRYGFDIAATWIHLRTVLAKDHDDLVATLDDGRTQMEVLISLWVVTIAFGVEAAVVSLMTGEPADSFMLLVALPIAYGLYRAGCARADSYTELMKAAVDLYRSELAIKLGITTTDDPEVERKAWAEIAAWFLIDEPPPRPANPPAVTTITTSAPDGIAITPVFATRIDPRPTPERAGGVRAEWIERHGFLIAHKVSSEGDAEEVTVQIVLSAGKAWRWFGRPPVEVTVRGAPGNFSTLQGGPAGDSLLIRLKLQGASSADLLLTHRPVVELLLTGADDDLHDGSITARFAQLPTLNGTMFTIEVNSTATESTPIEFVFRCDWAGDLAPTFLLGGKPLSPSHYADASWRTAAFVAAGRTVLVIELIGNVPKPAGSEDPSKPS